MTYNNDFFIQSTDSLSGYKAIFEDDGRVAYAYLLKDEEIVADVWLYNRGEPPAEPEWRNPDKAPFANPKGYASIYKDEPISDESDVDFTWVHNQARLVAVEIKLKGKLYGRLTPGSKPGWSMLAIKDGPLAKVMKDN